MHAPCTHVHVGVHACRVEAQSAYTLHAHTRDVPAGWMMYALAPVAGGKTLLVQVATGHHQVCVQVEYYTSCIPPEKPAVCNSPWYCLGRRPSPPHRQSSGTDQWKDSYNRQYLQGSQVHTMPADTAEVTSSSEFPVQLAYSLHYNLSLFFSLEARWRPGWLLS